MNTTIAKFMGLAITVILIAGLIFVVGANTINKETADYNTSVEEQQAPTTQQVITGGLTGK